jgi:hypothetical protein
MAASYPTAVKSFTTRTDGPSSTISASHMNDVQDEIAAVEDALINGISHVLPVDAGIEFPAVQAASSGANVLDDYEEGSWTPVIGGSGGTSGQAYTVQVGRYVKIGKLVTVQFRATLSNKGTITTNVQIQGLPFAAENTANLPASAALIFSTLATTWVNVMGQILPNTSVIEVFGATAAAQSNTTSLTTADIQNTTVLEGTVTYRASA